MRNSCLPLALLGPAFAWAQPPASAPTSYPYQLRGQLGTFNAPAKVYLVRGDQRLDSATLQHGHFELQGTTPQPLTVSLVLERQGRLQDGWREQLVGGEKVTMYVESADRIRLFLEPGPVVVTSPDSVHNARVQGGPLTADYQQHQAALKLLNDKRAKAGPKGDFKAFRDEIAQADKAFIKAHPASWVSVEILQQLPLYTPYSETAPLYAALSPALRHSPAGQQYGQRLAKQKATAIGAQAPDFVLPTPAGRPVSLADYRGKYVLLDFWASWCHPCRAEHPQLLQAYTAYKNRNFEVLSISLDEGRAKWLQAIADDQLPWTQVADLRGLQNEAAQRYNVQGIPQNFLVDPTGKIVAVNLHGDDLVTQLAPYLK
ncbi:TlpA disulfide reductase family protein [Hymenobacter sp. YC55]|uniref:TlpA disulfide reductase family protein n=1 Tax=Hymenobacter sp. YC55 TaxID=3034019 RepID=UPI0023F736D9|nr:TlpA disulfide reductase family protein [Hymenobacter sp. YC55]MDF7815759.1 TlpA disulfide reductase family protein [Hymenobacter sp. YC55]